MLERRKRLNECCRQGTQCAKLLLSGSLCRALSDKRGTCWWRKFRPSAGTAVVRAIKLLILQKISSTPFLSARSAAFRNAWKCELLLFRTSWSDQNNRPYPTCPTRLAVPSFPCSCGACGGGGRVLLPGHRVRRSCSRSSPFGHLLMLLLPLLRPPQTPRYLLVP